MPNLLQDIAAMGLSRGYERYVLQMEPLLQAMSGRGIPVSPAKHAEVTAQIEQQLKALEAEMQQLVPDAVRGCTPPAGYKKEPKDTAGLVRRWFNVEGTAVERWCRLKKWSPSGGARGGLIRYMKHKKHPVPRAFKTDKETTSELELRRLAKSTRDPLYAKVIEFREMQTLLSNHVKNWTPGPDGRVHPTFYYETGTGQLGARRPNSMNAPKHKANQGKIFRSMIVAREGYTLVELDYKAFHVQTLAFEAQDADLLRLAKLDVHSFLTAHFLRLSDAERLAGLETEDLRERLARIKREHKHTRDAKVKHALLGYNNGMGYRKCYYQYMEFFEGQNEAKRIFELLDGLFPKAKAYRQRVCDLAHQQGYLISRYGCIRWFWEVYKWSAGKWSYGEDHEAALCYFTQNDAHCHLKEAMLRIREDGLDDKYGLINPIHDALMFECPTPLVDEAVAEISNRMMFPSVVLTDPVVAPFGLIVEVAASTGPSWDRMVDR